MTVLAVAMSGGIDSAVAAGLMVEAGHDVFGITVKTWVEASRCCSDDDVWAAKRTAAHLGIKHYVVDLGELFEKNVIGHFVDEYAMGRTPTPCVMCNSTIKFGALMDRVLRMGAGAMVTGHYAILEKDGEGPIRLRQGVDPDKDQSYFLFSLAQQQLANSRFPLGGMRKSEVRAIAARLKLPLQDRPESQDICFVPKTGEHHAITEKHRSGLVREGAIVDESGKTLGRHQGVHRFTIGQRKSLGIATGTPMYVKELDVVRNRVVVAPRRAIYGDEALLKRVRWVSGVAPAVAFDAQTRIRYNHAAAASRVTPQGDGVKVDFNEEQFAITPGQAAVFYRDDEVLGGGWIEKPQEPNA